MREQHFSLLLVRAKVIIVLLCVFLPLPAFGSTFTAFGPRTYERGTGTAVAVVDTFSVLNPNTTYKIEIINGGLEDDVYEPVSSCTIELNGVQIIGPDDFNQSVFFVEKPVDLLTNNVLSVIVKGKPGGVLVINVIEGVDNDAPVIVASITPAANSAGWHNTDVTVSFDCSDATSNIVTCPDPILVNTEGANQVILGTAVDGAGNTASTAVTLNIDKTPPTLSLVSPSPGSAIAVDSVELQLSYGDNLAIAPDRFAVSVLGEDRTEETLRLTAGATLSLVGLPSGQVSVVSSITDRADNLASISESFEVTTGQGATAFRGEVRDSHNETPLAGATIEVEGTALATTTGADGHFLLENAPFGEHVLVVDGRTVAGVNSYPRFTLPVNIVEDAINDLGRPIFLPALNLQEAVLVEPSMVDPVTGVLNTDLTVRNSEFNVTMDVPAGTIITFPGGEHSGQELSITDVPVGFTPRSLPPGLRPSFVISVQPAGTIFDPPLPITFPNLDSLVDGNKVNLWFLDHDIGKFFIAGRGTVTGGLIPSDGGVVRGGSWGIILPPPPDVASENGGNNERSGNNNDNNCTECGVPAGSLVGLRSGHLTLEHELPGLRVFGQSRVPKLVYTSDRAFPTPIIKQQVTIGQGGPVPASLAYDLTVSGIPVFGESLHVDTALLEEDLDEVMRQGLIFDGSFLPTGSHPYFIGVESQFATSGSTAFANGRVTITNDKDSPFGAGWTLEGHSRLHVQPRRVLLAQGDGTSILFEEDQSDSVPRIACANGKAYVLHRNGIGVIDTVSETILGEVTPRVSTTTGSGQGSFFAASPDGSTLYVIGRGEVVVVDTSTDNVTATVEIDFARALAIAPDGASVYVTGGFNVSVIDTATNTVAATVSLAPSGPWDLAITPDGASVYTVNRNSDSVSVISTASNSVTATIDVGSIPEILAIAPDGSAVYVVNVFSNSVSVIDTATNSVVATVPVGSGPRALAFSPDGSAVYVLNPFSDSVSVIDTATNRRPTNVRVGSFPRALAIAPDGLAVYVANSNSVSVIDATINKVTSIVNVLAPLALEVTPDSRAIYVASADTSVSVIDAQSLSIRTTLRAFLAGPNQLAITPDGTSVYVDGLFNVSVIDTASNSAAATIDVVSRSRDLAIAPNGSTVYVINSSSFSPDSVSMIDTATNTVRATVNVGLEPQALAVAPDGTAVYVSNFDSNSVSVIDTATDTVTATVNVGLRPSAIAVTPDSAKVYVAEDSSSNSVSVIETTSNSLSATVSVGMRPTALTISPDGAKVYVANLASDTVSVIETASDTVTATIGVGNAPQALAVTPNGDTVYVSNRFSNNVGDFSVSVIDTATNSTIKAVKVGASPSFLAVTPDGSAVYVVSSSDDSVSVIETATNTVVATVGVGTRPVALAITGDGSAVYVSTPGESAVSVIDTATNTLTATVEGTSSFSVPLGVLFLGDGANAGPTLFRSPPGEFSSLERDDGGTPSQPLDDIFMQVFPNGSRNLFGPTGLQIAQVDRNGNEITYEYNPLLDRLVKITNPAGRWLEFAYDSRGKATDITDSAGRTTSLVIDDSGDLVSIINADGSLRTFDYDGNHLAQRQTDSLGFATLYEYDDFGRIRSTTRAGGAVTTFTPSDVLGVLDPSTGVGTSESPAELFMRDQVQDGLVDPNGSVTNFETNRFGQVTAVTDPVGNVTLAERDASGNVTRLVRTDGSVQAMTWDGRGNVLSVTERRLPDDPTDDVITSFTYDPVFNQVTSSADPRGNTTTMEYDGRGNLVSLTDAVGVLSEFTYDARGLPLLARRAVGTPSETETHFEYDASTGDLLSVVDQLGRVDTFTHDQAGNVASIQDPLGRLSQFDYDEFNRIVSSIDPLGSLTRLTYDNKGQVIEVADFGIPPGVTTFEYDSRGRLSLRTDSLGHSDAFGYDAVGNLITTTDRKGQVFSLTYDALDRLTSKSLPNGEQALLTYDSRGNLLTVTDADTDLSFTYDSFRRLSSATTAAGLPSQPPVTIEYQYDKAGNRTALVAPGVSVAYEYDAANRLTKLTDVLFLEVFTLSYDSLGRRTGVTVPNGSVGEFTYDAASQLTNLSYRTGAVDVLKNSYSYDEAGNILAETTLQGTNEFSYDVLNRLTSAVHASAANPPESFSYDAAGNINADTRVYNTANQLLQDDQSAYDYDLNGNLVRRTSLIDSSLTEYVYDPENQLIAVSGPGVIATYAYDGLGRRVQKSVNGVKTKYIYDREDILQEFNGANDLVANYSHGPGIDEPLAKHQDGQSFFFLQDQIGSVVKIADSNGTPVNEYEYSAFGALVDSSEAVANSLTFTGRERDPETGFYYYRARYYDSGIGRFVSEDPIGLTGGLNLYSYVDNNPIRFTDPYGEFLFFAPVVVKAISVVVLAAVTTATIVQPVLLAENELRKARGQQALPTLPPGQLRASRLLQINETVRAQLQSISMSRGIAPICFGK